MTDALATTITAVVGVLGTLFAPVLTHRLSARQRVEESELADRRRAFEERRDAYTAMNRASRQFHTLLKDALHRLRDDVYGDHEREQLEEARRYYRDRYAEAQMVVPERILEASRSLNTALASIDAVAKRLDRGRAGEGESAQQALLDLKQAEPRLSTMRRLMREDLGVRD
ncbi:hypothetical protein [Streptomyces resistomycificus]|uniref:Uncharacterized protein n=1 Tax=Streptomyces resistomycificus TaxID=67356 RepID=A0A0L8L3V1_9ACTN|nr:hypothetical protein [Streptomyces resistomycificus]KOG32736.1 hypothetical protein ADK37_25850 [Streptomyces resistomycificus]KUN92160.1 hypothetical protein AQJ84_34650 [Streptomyces resistomycificus]